MRVRDRPEVHMPADVEPSSDSTSTDGLRAVWQGFDCHRSSLEIPVLRKESESLAARPWYPRCASDYLSFGSGRSEVDDGSPVNVQGLARWMIHEMTSYEVGADGIAPNKAGDYFRRAIVPIVHGIQPDGIGLGILLSSSGRDANLSNWRRIRNIGVERGPCDGVQPSASLGVSDCHKSP